MGRDVSLSRAFRRSRRFKKVTEALGVRVRDLRKWKGWTLEKASAKIGIDFRHLQQIEAGTVNVTLATILRLCDALEVSPFVLLPRAKETKSKLGVGRVRTIGVIMPDVSGFLPRHPGQVMENPTEPLPPAELAEVKKRVGGAIKQRRHAKGLTQKRLATLMGVSVQHVQAVEGGSNLTVGSILKFAKALGVDPRDFW